MALRDVVDYLDYDVDPRVWIEALLRQIDEGTYQPRPPERFTLAKSNGFSRRMAIPHLPDLVLFRTIVDTLYARSKRNEHEHVYFEQEQIERKLKEIDEEESRMRAAGEDSFWRALSEEVADYESNSTKRFRAWLHYHQYRRMLIFKKVYPYIVTADISNFFDSVLYAKVADALHGISAPPGLVNLLFLLLERLSFRGELSENCRLGLPVEEFDCSRKLAHMVLYPHDHRMVQHLGEAAYVRWMDDQNYGVNSRADGLRALAETGRSLSRLHLTANTGKSRILTLAEARRHFHLDLNEGLDRLDKLPHAQVKQRRELGRRVRALWSKAQRHSGRGEWQKVLKRFYLFAGRGEARFLRRYTVDHLISYPQLAQRICDYMRCSGSAEEYLRFVDRIWANADQVYEDVNLVVADSLLRVEATGLLAKEFAVLASALLKRFLKFPGSILCASISPLLILRFGDGRSLPLLRSAFTTRRNDFPPRITRASSIVYAGYGSAKFAEIRNIAATLESNYLAEAVRLLERVLQYKEVPTYYSSRFDLRKDSMSQRHYIDMRTLVALRLLRLNRAKEVQAWIRSRVKKWKSSNLSDFDRALLRRTIESLPQPR